MPNPILQMLSGGNPRKLNPQMIAQAKQMFYAACKQYGIDPEDILSQVRGEL